MSRKMSSGTEDVESRGFRVDGGFRFRFRRRFNRFQPPRLPGSSQNPRFQPRGAPLKPLPLVVHRHRGRDGPERGADFVPEVHAAAGAARVHRTRGGSAGFTTRRTWRNTRSATRRRRSRVESFDSISSDSDDSDSCPVSVVRETERRGRAGDVDAHVGRGRRRGGRARVASASGGSRARAIVVVRRRARGSGRTNHAMTRQHPCLTTDSDNLRHFQWHWSRGHPVIVTEVDLGGMSWSPAVMERAYANHGQARSIHWFPIRPRWRGECRSLRTFPGVSLRPHLGF